MVGAGAEKELSVAGGGAQATTAILVMLTFST